VTLRTATAADLPRVAALERAVFPQDPLPLLALVQYRELFEPLFLVVEGAEGLDAYGVAGIAAGGRVGWLLSAAVAPSARGRGLGGALTQALVARLWAAGVVEIRATVAPTNTPSRRMLAAAGLEVLETAPDYFGPGEDRLILSARRPEA
jgi:ribosomal-protein-alanine N-acetyltransferase